MAASPSLAGKNTIAIIDYGSGNLHSVKKALEHVARARGLGEEIIVTRDPADVRAASRLVLPGVGAFADCRRGVDSLPGMIDALQDVVLRGAKPFLGICVGMQLLATRGLEHETTLGFNWIAGDVVKIEPHDPHIKVPHMGWNTLDVVRDHALLKDVVCLSVGEDEQADKPHAYFVHSYHFVPRERSDIVATTSYAGHITALVARDNIAGVQFHPEKSQELGLKLLENFLDWSP